MSFFLWQKFLSEFWGSLGMVDGKIGGLVVWDSTRGAFNITVPFITGSRIQNPNHRAPNHPINHQLIKQIQVWDDQAKPPININ